jgi:YD repeat-containing protein
MKKSPAPVAPPSQIHADLMPICDIDCDGSGSGGGAGGSDPFFGTNRKLPPNSTGAPGVTLGSRNFNWALPILRLPGRAGMDLDITLYYNSLVWIKQGSQIQFNPAKAFAGAPGFSLGFPTLQARFIDQQTYKQAYTMVTPSGGTVSLQQTAAGASTYESLDGAHTYLVEQDANTPVQNIIMRTTDGTQYYFSYNANVNEYRCYTIKDRNGNYISISYNALARPQQVVDTLGRTINFNYDSNNYLVSISQTWTVNGSQQTHNYATFQYTTIGFQPSFSGLTVVADQTSSIPVLQSVMLADNTNYVFDYTAFGQVTKISRQTPDDNNTSNYITRAYTFYNMDTSAGQTDCPRFTQQKDWAQDWNGGAEAVTNYSVDPAGAWTQVTYPDGTYYKEYYDTSWTWMNGLITGTELYDSGNTRQKWTTTQWTQDDTSQSYQINPRPFEINVYDASGNRRRTTINYDQYTLPKTSTSMRRMARRCCAIRKPPIGLTALTLTTASSV